MKVESLFFLKIFLSFIFLSVSSNSIALPGDPALTPLGMQGAPEAGRCAPEGTEPIGQEIADINRVLQCQGLAQDTIENTCECMERNFGDRILNSAAYEEFEARVQTFDRLNTSMVGFNNDIESSNIVALINYIGASVGEDNKPFEPNGVCRNKFNAFIDKQVEKQNVSYDLNMLLDRFALRSTAGEYAHFNSAGVTPEVLRQGMSEFFNGELSADSKGQREIRTLNYRDFRAVGGNEVFQVIEDSLRENGALVQRQRELAIERNQIAETGARVGLDKSIAIESLCNSLIRNFQDYNNVDRDYVIPEGPTSRLGLLTDRELYSTDVAAYRGLRSRYLEANPNDEENADLYFNQMFCREFNAEVSRGEVERVNNPALRNASDRELITKITTNLDLVEEAARTIEETRLDRSQLEAQVNHLKGGVMKRFGDAGLRWSDFDGLLNESTMNEFGNKVMALINEKAPQLRETNNELYMELLQVSHELYQMNQGLVELTLRESRDLAKYTVIVDTFEKAYSELQARHGYTVEQMEGILTPSVTQSAAASFYRRISQSDLTTRSGGVGGVRDASRPTNPYALDDARQLTGNKSFVMGGTTYSLPPAPANRGNGPVTVAELERQREARLLNATLAVKEHDLNPDARLGDPTGDGTSLSMTSLISDSVGRSQARRQGVIDYGDKMQSLGFDAPTSLYSLEDGRPAQLSHGKGEGSPASRGGPLTDREERSQNPQGLPSSNGAPPFENDTTVRKLTESPFSTEPRMLAGQDQSTRGEAASVSPFMAGTFNSQMIENEASALQNRIRSQEAQRAPASDESSEPEPWLAEFSDMRRELDELREENRLLNERSLEIERERQRERSTPTDESAVVEEVAASESSTLAGLGTLSGSPSSRDPRRAAPVPTSGAPEAETFNSTTATSVNAQPEAVSTLPNQESSSSGFSTSSETIEIPYNSSGTEARFVEGSARPQSDGLSLTLVSGSIGFSILDPEGIEGSPLEVSLDFLSMSAQEKAQFVEEFFDERSGDSAIIRQTDGRVVLIERNANFTPAVRSAVGTLNAEAVARNQAQVVYRLRTLNNTFDAFLTGSN